MPIVPADPRHSKDPKDLKDRVVVITGAAGGIGRALARRFARERSRLALLDIDAAGLDQLRAELEAGAHAVRAFTCDLTDQARCATVIAEVIDDWGGVDVLVNNAGLTHFSLFRDTDPDVLRRVMEVNFFGAVACTRAAYASLAARGGTMVAVSSVAGFAPLLGRAGYVASKHALEGFANTLRAELEPAGGHVLVVSPSFVDTPIDAHALGGDGRQKGQTRKPSGDVLTPEQVADAIVRGVRRRERVRRLSAMAKASYWLAHVAPAVFERLMRRQERKNFPELNKS